MVPRIEPAGTPYPAEVQAVFDKILPPGVPPLRLFTTLAAHVHEHHCSTCYEMMLCSDCLRLVSG
jgi:hypothetical protein